MKYCGLILVYIDFGQKIFLEDFVNCDPSDGGFIRQYIVNSAEKNMNDDDIRTTAIFHVSIPKNVAFG